MKTDISIQYSTHSISIVLHLLHNNEDYNKLWIKKFPKTKAQASNFFKNEILVVSLVFISSLLFCYLGRYIKKHYLKFSHKTFNLAEGFLFFSLGISIVINHIQGGY